MSIEDTIAADQAAVEAAQAALDAANATLAADQGKLAAVQPHLDILTAIEAKFVALETDIADDLRAALTAVQAEISPLLAQMRSLINQ